MPNPPPNRTPPIPYPDPAVIPTLDGALLERLQYLRRLQQLKAERDRRRHARYQSDPASWVENELHGELWSKQREILQSLVDHRKTAVRSCHNIGKSHLAAVAVAWWISTYPDAFVVTTAPTFNQVKVVLWRYIRRLHRDHNLPGRCNQTEWIVNDEIVAFGRKPADYDATGFQGIHAAHVLVIIDEAGGVPDSLWDAADSLASNEGCRMLAIGNPDTPGTRFQLIQEIGSTWHPIHISAYDSPNITGEPISDRLRRLLVSRQWVDEKLIDWGEDNPVYVSKVLGQFPTQDPHSVVRIRDINACRLVDTPHPYTLEQLTPVELGVDVGGGGDLTVIRERRGILAGREWVSRSDRPEELAPLVARLIRETRATAVKIDAIGIGWGLVGELRNSARRREHNAAIHAVKVSERSTQPTKYRNLRSEMWWRVGREQSAARAWDLSAMDNADQTIAELLTPRYIENTNGQIEVESKKDIRKRQHGRSPDHADALLLAYLRPRATLDGFFQQLAGVGVQ